MNRFFVAAASAQISGIRALWEDERGDILQYLLVVALLIVYFLPKISSLQTSIGGVFSQLGTTLSTI